MIDKLIDKLMELGIANRLIASLSLYLLFFILVYFGFGDIYALDLRFHYSADDAYKLLQSLGEDGRQSYFRGLLVDFIYMISYTLLLTSLVAYLLRKIGKRSNIVLIPLAPLLFDFLENNLILMLLFQYPKKLEILAKLSGTVTSLKWIAVLINVLVILTLCVYYLRLKNVLATKNFDN